MQRMTLDVLLGLASTLGLLALLALAGDNMDDRQAQWSRQIDARAIENGANLYASHCRSCHGVNGEGVGELGPALHEANFFTTRLQEVGWAGTMAEYLEGTIAMGRVTATRSLYAGNGTAVMNAWAQAYGGPLRPDEIRDLSAFIENWEASALGVVELEPLIIPTVAARSGDPAAGQILFLESGCADCHALRDLSNAEAGPDLSQIGQQAAMRVAGVPADAYLRESFLIPNAYIVEGYLPSTGCGGVLTHEQLDDLVAFLLTLK